MRIVAWNCCRGPMARKAAALESLQPDVAVLCEALAPPAPSYTQAFLNGLSAYARLLGRGPAVVAGDFNGNPVFDKAKQRVRWWTTGFAQLHAAGLVSAYHQFNGVGYGDEGHATHHFLRKPERPFHIDFCFVPQAWAERRLDVRVAHGTEWATLSDHFPLVVDTDA